MLVKSSITGETYVITWQYANDLFETPRFTYCMIHKLNADGTKELIVRGQADCNYRDQFCKNTGRKLSLSRALITRVPVVSDPSQKNPQRWEPIFSRNTRLDFWNAYFEMRGKIG